MFYDCLRRRAISQITLFQAKPSGKIKVLKGTTNWKTVWKNTSKTVTADYLLKKKFSVTARFTVLKKQKRLFILFM